MRMDAGSTNLTSAGSAQIIDDSPSAIVFITIQAKPGNTGDIYIGVSDVSSSNGWTLQPGESKDLDFDPLGAGQSITFDQLFFDGATTNDDIEWIVFFKQ